jgi:hypothetical protein
MTRIIALTAPTTLGLSGAPVHERVHGRDAAFPLVLLLCVMSPRAPCRAALPALADLDVVAGRVLGGAAVDLLPYVFEVAAVARVATTATG